MRGVSTQSWQQELKTRREVSRLGWRNSLERRTSFWVWRHKSDGTLVRQKRFKRNQMRFNIQQPTRSCRSSSSVHSSRLVCLMATSCPEAMWRPMRTWLRLLKPRPVDQSGKVTIFFFRDVASGPICSLLTQLGQQLVVTGPHGQACDVMALCWPLECVLTTVTALERQPPTHTFCVFTVRNIDIGTSTLTSIKLK